MAEIAIPDEDFLIQSRLFNHDLSKFLVVITDYKLCSLK